MAIIAEIGNAVAKRRKELSLSQDELAQKAELSRTYISLIERGEAQNVSRTVVERLAQALDVTPGMLTGAADLVDLRVPAALKEYALQDKLTLDVVEWLVKMPRRGPEPKSAAEWKALYDAVKQWL